MTIDNWFILITFVGVYVCCLLLLDGAHRARIAELKHVHREQVDGLRSYIRTLSRERMWLEAELQRMRDKLAQRDQVQAAPEHIQLGALWAPLTLPPSEEYEEEDG